MAHIKYCTVLLNVKVGCKITVWKNPHFFCTLVLQATYGEASSRKGQESQLSKENSGQPQGEVSSN